MNKHTLLAAIFMALLFTTAFAETYVITGSGTSFTAAKGIATVGIGAIQVVVDAIKTDADGSAVSIRFGDGDAELDIGTAGITFSGGNSGTDWGKITLSGGITSANTSGTIYLSNEVSIESGANIKNTASSNYYSHAISNSGTLTITGGTISATYGYEGTILNSGTGTLTISDGMISAGSGTAIENSGAVTITGGTISSIFGYNGTLTIAGGTISSISISNPFNATLLTIIGGTISSISNNNTRRFQKVIATLHEKECLCLRYSMKIT